MGERKCTFEGCNALEFRTTGYCLRHKGGLPEAAPNAIKINNMFYDAIYNRGQIKIISGAANSPELIPDEVKKRYEKV